MAWQQQALTGEIKPNGKCYECGQVIHQSNNPWLCIVHDREALSQFVAMFKQDVLANIVTNYPS